MASFIATKGEVKKLAFRKLGMVCSKEE